MNQRVDGRASMNGVHDLGGMHGLGSMGIEDDEPVFHATWEARTLALNLAMGRWGKWNIDASRHEIERLPAADAPGQAIFPWDDLRAELLRMRSDFDSGEPVRR